ncbi:MAG: 2-C-methyl-D-erythritol 4-phosphate cytidylyltransferase [Ignavibacteriae bacterium]|nr:2-C-methyl-D-erythritol 4-phosphate cytidylyltransferase [Ignavibacteriota bacterium]MCB9215602.1 2-C-methyl-D-erythritol 4-phosphate cytidylyltransferase [Ignavibacteria bacterium]
MMRTFSLILPAAGVGKRSGLNRPKQYAEIAGEPMLRWTIKAFAQLGECREIVVAIDPEWQAVAEDSVGGISNVRFVEGGRERQDSIRNGLNELEEKVDVILVHDAARPAVSTQLIRRVVERAAESGAAIPAMPIAETVKRVRDNRIVETLPRANLVTAQTPQGFHPDILRRAYAHALETGFVGTDDASLVEALGERVEIVAGEPTNIKVTWPEDVERVEQILGRG